MRHPGHLPLRGILVCAGVTLGVVFGSAFAASTPSRGQPKGQAKGQLSRSDICGECHKDIYRMWRASAHSRSMEDPIFLDAYRETDASEGETVSRICLGCHAPAAGILKDPKLAQKITWEGVSCDICHVLTAVQFNGLVPVMTFSPGPVKHGPIENAVSGRHEIMYSELHTKALVCAGCHQFVNGEGTPIMTTYSEWEQSAAAREGKGCQACHMGRQKADVVDPKVLRVPDSMVNLHEVPGGHSLEQLNKALAVTIRPVHVNGELQLEVDLRNNGAGHAVPTGMPGRRVELQIRVQTSEGKAYEEQKSYGETFTDAAGELIARDSGYFARGVKHVADTRIQSGEQRVESFRFPVSPTASADIAVKLHYQHSPTGGKENQTSITFYSEQRTVGPESPAGR
jgi:hypothetical protein